MSQCILFCPHNESQCCFIPNILHNIFCLVQQRASHTGWERHEAFWGKHLSNFSFLTLIFRAVILEPNLEAF